jgi:hypothetical protein
VEVYSSLVQMNVLEQYRGSGKRGGFFYHPFYHPFKFDKKPDSGDP